jgi:hypothetical protein
MGRCAVLVTAFTALSLPAVSASGATAATWSRHKCDVVAVTYARTHHTSKAVYAAYLKGLNKQHGCTFRV